MENVIRIENLTKTYGKKRGVENVSFEVGEGEIFGFIGPNGAGKSTTIRSMLGFLKFNSGSIEILGKDNVKDHEKILKEVGYMPSEALFYPAMKVSEVFKSLLIWALTVGGLGFFCTLMYTSMEGDVMEMADTFSQMGAFSDAFGMSTLSIATLAGFFATEVGTVHGLGSAMYAAFFGASMLSKEEDGHTGEYLYSLPVSRGKAVIAKEIAILVNLILFTIICGLFYVMGFAALKEELPAKEMSRFLCSMLLMNDEVASI